MEDDPPLAHQHRLCGFNPLQIGSNSTVVRSEEKIPFCNKCCDSIETQKPREVDTAIRCDGESVCLTRRLLRRRRYCVLKSYERVLSPVFNQIRSFKENWIRSAHCEVRSSASRAALNCVPSRQRYVKMFDASTRLDLSLRNFGTMRSSEKKC